MAQLRAAVGRAGGRATEGDRQGPGRKGPLTEDEPTGPAAWALTVATDAWMRGHVATVRWCTGFSAASFLVVLLAWRISPNDR
ncbi:hypothetical protein [Kitasatospora sp. NPDC088134]|uniref:hypothetical protein n=1 Tax=Kitasatospora sp. NPDC088134 TaxID=3364071 RepID=UPI00380A9539